MEMNTVARTKLGVYRELASRDELALINQTNLVLIPKKQSFVKVKDFRPFSSCNVVYKIISKVLVNRRWGTWCNNIYLG